MIVNQKYHYVCLPCRRSIKGPPKWEFTLVDGREIWHTLPMVCGHCGGEMLCLGKKFAAPKRRDNAQWKKLAWMIENGWRGTNWPVALDMNLNQVRENLRAVQIVRDARLQREKARESFEITKRYARNLRTVRKRATLEMRAQRKYQDTVLARAKAVEN